jgi:hypothetical protein
LETILGKDLIFLKQFANLRNYFAKTIGKKLQMQNSEFGRKNLFFFVWKNLFILCQRGVTSSLKDGGNGTPASGVGTEREGGSGRRGERGR